MQRFPTLSIVLLVIALSGCPVARSPEPAQSSISDPVDAASLSTESSTESSAAEPLGQWIDRVLAENLANRTLSNQVHGAWQIMHGVLAYGDRFEVETPLGKQSAIKLALQGGFINGFDPEPGDWFTALSQSQKQSVGIRMAMDPSTKLGQGHRDQWLAIVSQSGLGLDEKIVAGGRDFTIGDWMNQVEYDVPRNLELEFSWTLIPLTTYRDTDHVWTARDGVQYATTELLQSELQQSLSASVCGGTHRLIGIAMAVNARRREGKPMTGVWADAQQRLQEAVAMAKENQNADGSFSASYLQRAGWTRDLGETLGTTGHVLEFLAFAADDQTLAQPWVKRSVTKLCSVLDQCRDVDLECGVLYHALHGLSQYRQRI